MREQVTLNGKEQKRLKVLNDLEAGLTLIAGIDDATSEMPAALFRPEEDAAGYFPLLRHIIERLGLPLGLYTDLHTISRSPKKIILDYAGQGHDGALEE